MTHAMRFGKTHAARFASPVFPWRREATVFVRPVPTVIQRVVRARGDAVTHRMCLRVAANVTARSAARFRAPGTLRTDRTIERIERTYREPRVSVGAPEVVQHDTLSRTTAPDVATRPCARSVIVGATRPVPMVVSRSAPIQTAPGQAALQPQSARSRAMAVGSVDGMRLPLPLSRDGAPSPALIADHVLRAIDRRVLAQRERLGRP